MWSILAKARNVFSCVMIQRFYVLPLEMIHEAAPKIPITIFCQDMIQKCSYETLRKIKGETKDWDQRWLRGDVCYIAFVGAEPIAHVWICYGEWRLRDEDKGHPLPQGCAFLYDARTREQWCGNGAYQALISTSARDLRSRGYASLYLLTNDQDLGARHAVEKSGFQHTKHCIYVYRSLRLFELGRDKATLLDGLSRI